MKYLLIHAADETQLGTSHDLDDAAATQLAAWIEEMVGRGVLVHGDRLRPTPDATSVRVTGGDVVVVDGPFAETKEQITGYDLIDCADLDEAIEIASKHPTTNIGTIEVRPLWFQ
ncbi:MAG TPA: YciI family protein [Pseudonocardiaceae bacterium]|nr:YciI family protein [Pseudonocardiaceae bacterium]